MTVKTISAAGYITALLMLSATSNMAFAYKPMPQVFSLDKDAAVVLRNYPLGILHRDEAFAHHGRLVRTVILPNGNSGWMYKVGEQAGIPNIYVLEISRDGYVVDVLHKDIHYKIGHSALQYQFLSGREIELRTTGPAPTR